MYTETELKPCPKVRTEPWATSSREENSQQTAGQCMKLAIRWTLSSADREACLVTVCCSQSTTPTEGFFVFFNIICI